MTASPAAGYTPVLVKWPPEGVLLCWLCEITHEHCVATSEDVFPAHDFGYLWWKLTGIGRMQLEARQ